MVTLFEFYAFFKLIDSIRQLKTKNFKLKKIEKGAKELVTAEDKTTNSVLYFYHNQQANFDFEYDSEKLKNEIVDRYNHKYLFRHKNIMMNHTNMVYQLLKKEHGKKKVFSGLRPDIILKIYDDRKKKELKTVIIGEIKNSSRKETLFQGLKELLKYIQFAKYNNRYLTEMYHDDEIKIYGILIVDDKPNTLSQEPIFKFKPFDECKEITIYILSADEITVDWKTIF
jgi:hypothetical protein